MISLFPTSSEYTDLRNSSLSLPSAPTTLTQQSSRPHLRRVLSRSPTPASTLLGLSSPRFQKLPIGAHVEVSPAAFKISRKVGEVLCVSDGCQSRPGGSGLIIDYGGQKVYGDSFRVGNIRNHQIAILTNVLWQAFKDHKIMDVFHRPGECDLTANVDFAYVQEAFSDLGAFYYHLISVSNTVCSTSYTPRTTTASNFS